MKRYELEKTKVDDLAGKLGFTEKFIPAESSNFLKVDDYKSRKFFYLSGGYTAMISLLPVRNNGPQRIIRWVSNTSVRAYWMQAYPIEATYIRKDEENIEFIDYYADKDGPKLTTGKFIACKYEGEVPDIQLKLYGLPLNCLDDSAAHEFTKEDDLALLLRDIRWENKKYTLLSKKSMLMKIIEYCTKTEVSKCTDKCKRLMNKIKNNNKDWVTDLKFNQEALEYIVR